MDVTKCKTETNQQKFKKSAVIRNSTKQVPKIGMPENPTKNLTGKKKSKETGQLDAKGHLFVMHPGLYVTKKMTPQPNKVSETLVHAAITTVYITGDCMHMGVKLNCLRTLSSQSEIKIRKTPK